MFSTASTLPAFDFVKTEEELEAAKTNLKREQRLETKSSEGECQSAGEAGLISGLFWSNPIDSPD